MAIASRLVRGTVSGSHVTSSCTYTRAVFSVAIVIVEYGRCLSIAHISVVNNHPALGYAQRAVQPSTPMTGRYCTLFRPTPVREREQGDEETVLYLPGSAYMQNPKVSPQKVQVEVGGETSASPVVRCDDLSTKHFTALGLGLFQVTLPSHDCISV